MADETNRPRHDQLIKYLMKDLSFSRGFLDFFLPKEKLERLDLSGLNITKSSYVDDRLDEHLADVVFEVPYRNSPDHTRIVILFEHKSYKDEQLPFQLLRYLSNAYVDQVENKLPRMPVMVVIFYHGKYPWNLQKMREGFDEIHKPFLHCVPDYDWIFINTNELDEQVLMKLEDSLLQSALLTQKYSHNVQGLLLRLETIIAALSKSKNYSHQRVILLYLSQLVPPETDIIPIVHKIDTKMAKEFISRYDFDIQKAEARGMEKGIEKGIQKGIQKGIEEGIKKGMKKGVEKGIEKGREAEKVALVLNAFLEGLPVHLISRLVDLSEDQVEAIVREMNT